MVTTILIVVGLVLAFVVLVMLKAAEMSLAVLKYSLKAGKYGVGVSSKVARVGVKSVKAVDTTASTAVGKVARKVTRGKSEKGLFGFAGRTVKKAKAGAYKVTDKGIQLSEKALKALIKAMTVLIDLLRTVLNAIITTLGALTGGLLAAIATAVAVLVLFVASAAGFLTLFTGYTTDPETGVSSGLTLGASPLMLGEDGVPIPLGGGRRGESSGGGSSTGSVGGNYTGAVATGSKPPGITDESWNKASALGKALASTAHNAVVNPPGGVRLVYQQGPPPDTKNRYDCSAFVSAVILQATGKSVLNNEGKFIIGTNTFGELLKLGKWSTQGFAPKVMQCPAKTLEQGAPGDIMYMSGHIEFFMGMNEKGFASVIGASSPSAKVFYDANATVPGTQVGYKGSWGWDYANKRSGFRMVSSDCLLNVIRSGK